MDECRNAFKIVTGNPAGKRPKHKWEESIRMNLKEIGVSTRNWIDSVQDGDYWRALVNVVLNLQFP